MAGVFEPLTRAEQVLVAELASGVFDRLGEGVPAADAGEERLVRAELLRFLLVGGEGAPRLHEKGLRLSGALIRGSLDLEGCRIPRDVALSDCRFEDALVLRSAVIDMLFLDGSVLPALLADNLEARCGVSLRGTEVEGPVRFRGARLGAAMICDGARFSRPGDAAFDGEGLEARGGVTFRAARVEGILRVAGSRIGGALDLSGAALANEGGDALDAVNATVDGDLKLRRIAVRGRTLLSGIRLEGDADLGGGQFEAPGDGAVEFGGAIVRGAFMLREGARVEGLLNLSGTTVDTLVDAAESWPAQGDLALNRFLYNAFLIGPSDARSRLDWLARQEPARWGEDFWPQPYERLAQVFTDMGHGEDAIRVLVAKERLQRRARRARARSRVGHAVLWAKDALLKVTVGYGRRPLLAFIWLALFWASGGALFFAVEEREAIRPNVPVVLRSPEWVLCGREAGDGLDLVSVGAERDGLAAPGQSQLACWLGRPEAASYPPYNPWIHALDTILPAFESGQADYWAPDVRDPLGYVATGFAYALTLAGWALSLLAVAGFSGLVRSK